MSYITLSSQKNTISEKNSFMTPFFYSVRTFARIRQHYFSKYWGDQCMGRPPPEILGDRPPSPPRSPPLSGRIFIPHRHLGFEARHLGYEICRLNYKTCLPESEIHHPETEIHHSKSDRHRLDSLCAFNIHCDIENYLRT